MINAGRSDAEVVGAPGRRNEAFRLHRRILSAAFCCGAESGKTLITVDNRSTQPRGRRRKKPRSMQYFTPHNPEGLISTLNDGRPTPVKLHSSSLSSARERLLIRHFITMRVRYLPSTR